MTVVEVIFMDSLLQNVYPLRRVNDLTRPGCPGDRAESAVLSTAADHVVVNCDKLSESDGP